MAGTGPRSSHQSRIDWWRAQFHRQRAANLSVTEFCRQLGVSVATFYYWKKRADQAPPDSRAPVLGVRAARPATTAASLVLLSIIEPRAAAELENELTNSCVLRFKGVIDPSLLQAAITAAGQLDGSCQGAH